MMTDSCQFVSVRGHFTAYNGALQICKPVLSLFIGFSTLTAYLVHQPMALGPAFFTAGSVFVLCCGCASLNNLQDRQWDFRFERTRKRVLPDNRLSPSYAGIQALVLIVSGLFMLKTLTIGFAPLALGVASVFLYNGLYTPLKSVSLVALAPGILCGMTPPLIGWVASGGNFPDARIVCLMMVVGLWQLPHLGLLILSHPKDYALGTIPCFLRQVSENALKRMIIIWVFNVSLMMGCLILHGVLISEITCNIVLCLAVFLIIISVMAIIRSRESAYRFLFVHLNTTLLATMVLIVSERIILMA